MKILNSLFLVLFLLQSCTNRIQDKSIIGIWQLAPYMGAGWTDSFTFFENGKLIFRINQTICDKREIGYEAEYEYKNDTLYIKKLYDIIIEGGELVDAKGSCSSEKEIVGGEIIKKETEHILIKYYLSTIKIDDNFKKLSININGNVYYKHKDNPLDY